MHSGRRELLCDTHSDLALDLLETCMASIVDKIALAQQVEQGEVERAFVRSSWNSISRKYATEKTAGASGEPVASDATRCNAALLPGGQKTRLADPSGAQGTEGIGRFALRD